MLTAPRHSLRPALVALATLAGMLLATTGASSAACETMKSLGSGSCPPSESACCCNPLKDDSSSSRQDRALPEVAEAATLPQPAAVGCCCDDRPEVPAEPIPGPSRSFDESRTDRVGHQLTVELPDLRPSPLPPGSRSAPVGGPSHVPLYVRHSRFLI